MTEFQQTFLSLLRMGLWGQAEQLPVKLNDTDWLAVYQMGRKQCVQGILFDALPLLQEEERPAGELLTFWVHDVQELEVANKRQIAAYTQLDFTFNLQHQLPFRLLKGQGIAKTYRNPLHRADGDLDLWFGPAENVEKANQIMEAQGAQVKRGNWDDSVYVWCGQEIEHHCHLIELHNPFFQKELMAWEKNVYETSKDIPTPCANLLLQITHILKHQLNGGIGFKQICDLAVSFQTLEYDFQELQELTKKYGVYRFSKLLASLVHTYLNVPEEKLPFPPTENAEPMLQEIWEAGNFGQHDTRFGNRPAGKWASKWYTLGIIAHKAKIFSFYAPGESFWWTGGLAMTRVLEALHLKAPAAQ